MILSFKPQFENKILDGVKIHTIREDKNNRWEVGRKIHFATGVRTSKYNQFKEGICTWIKGIKILPSSQSIKMSDSGKDGLFYDVSPIIKSCIIRLDGFEHSGDFWEWFDIPFSGVIIGWDRCPYSLGRQEHKPLWAFSNNGLPIPF